MRKWIFFGLSAMLILSCRRDGDVWQQKAYLPLFKSQWRLVDLLPDSVVSVDDDGTVVLRSRQAAFRFDADSLLMLDDTMTVTSEKIENLTLGTRVSTSGVTLGQIARAMNDSLGNDILLNHGKLRFIDSFDDSHSPPVDVDITDLFVQAAFLAGTMTLEVTNGFKIDLRELVLEVRNKNLGTVVLRDSIPYLAVGQTHTSQFSMAGLTIEGQLTAQMVNVSSPGTPVYPIVIDTNDALQIKVTTADMRVQSATARFPEQDIVHDSIDVIYHLDDQQIEEVRYRSGTLVLGLEHTFPVGMHLIYQAPDLRRNGAPLEIQVDVPASPDGTARRDSVEIDLAGYHSDLRGIDGDSFNVSFAVRRLRMDSSVGVITLTAQDSVRVFSSLRNQRLAYVRGYLGKDTVDFREEVAVDDVSAKRWGAFHFREAAVKFFMENTFGMDFSFRIDSLQAVRLAPSQAVSLTSSLLGQVRRIDGMSDPAGWPVQDSLVFDSVHSNITDLINLSPDRWMIKGRIIANPTAFPGRRDQFMTEQSSFSVGVEYELPLRVRIQDLRVSDTFEMTDLPMDGGASVMWMHWKAANQYPVAIRIQAYVWDSAGGRILDSLFIDGPMQIQPAEPQGASSDPMGRVFDTTESKGRVPLTPERMQTWQSGTHWIVRAEMNTRPPNRHVVFYDDYALHFSVYAETTTNIPVK